MACARGSRHSGCLTTGLSRPEVGAFQFLLVPEPRLWATPGPSQKHPAAPPESSCSVSCWNPPRVSREPGCVWNVPLPAEGAVRQLEAEQRSGLAGGAQPLSLGLWVLLPRSREPQFPDLGGFPLGLISASARQAGP